MRGIIELSLDRIPGATHSVVRAVVAFGIRVASLDHETGDYSMENSPIIKPFLG